MPVSEGRRSSIRFFSNGLHATLVDSADGFTALRVVGERRFAIHCLNGIFACLHGRQPAGSSQRIPAWDRILRGAQIMRQHWDKLQEVRTTCFVKYQKRSKWTHARANLQLSRHHDDTKAHSWSC